MVGNKVAEKITKVVSKTTWEDPKELSAQTDETAQLIRIPIYIYIYISRTEYQVIINLLNTSKNEPLKLRTKNCVEVNDYAHGTYNTNSQITFKTTMLKSSVCDYRDPYILVKGIGAGARADAAARNADYFILNVTFCFVCLFFH